MKIRNSPKLRREGMATIVILTILSIMFLFTVANLRALKNLDRQIKLLDQRQTKRLVILSATNSIRTNSPVINFPSTPPPAH
jgi:hypothetical protein